MAYKPPITINDAILEIQHQNYVLPSIQREFVWTTKQITMLFDSLMREYPIGTFLFWKIDKNRINDFQFYKFLDVYHEKNSRHNQKLNLPNDKGVIAVLDGQQRMTSLYLALTGSYATKKGKMYPERKLYLNITKESEDLEMKYDFQFLTKEESLRVHGNKHWVDCGKIRHWKNDDKISEYLENNGINRNYFGKHDIEFAKDTLRRFYKVINEDEIINFYQEEGEELDKVLQIFIRINSGGTTLHHSDLLLSIATAEWSTDERDAREIVHEFVDDINRIGNGFKFTKDLVMKSWIVLADFDVVYKVDNFTSENMKIIEKSWGKMSSAIMTAIELISLFGYNGRNLSASNAVIPIAYFIYKNECEDEILQSSSRKHDRECIKEWLARVLIKGTLGSAADSIYPIMRDLINQHKGRFPLKEIIDSREGGRKSISFSNLEIDTLLNLGASGSMKAKTYCALTLLYPELNHNINFHMDHIHPKSKFTKASMRAAGFSEPKIEEFNAQVNGIANLQLIASTSNIEKSDKPFVEWVHSEHTDKTNRYAFLAFHKIDPEQSLAFNDFLEFIDIRKKAIKKEFLRILGGDENESEI